MSYAVILPNGGRGTTDAFGSSRPMPGDYFSMSVGGVVSTYKAAWVNWTGGAPTIGAALPSDGPPNPPA